MSFNLPPGCSINDIPGTEDDPPQPLCVHCHAFLLSQPDQVVPFEDSYDCDGTVEVVQEGYDEATLAIIGEEYRGKTYDLPVSKCGIGLEEHAPHRVVLACGENLIWICKKCGGETCQTQL